MKQVNASERYKKIQNELKKMNESQSLVSISNDLKRYNINIPFYTLFNYINKDKTKIYANVLNNIEDLEVYFDVFYK